MSPQTCVLLVQLGTPDSPSVKDVRRYLFEFLNDPRVIDIPALLRAFLVNIIIVPFRAPKSAKVYQHLWTEKGSPLLLYTEEVVNLLQKELGTEYKVEFAMRYQNPSLEKVLGRIKKANYEKIIVLPLFPQYASATTGSAVEKVMKIMSKWWVIPEVRFIGQFYDHPAFIDAFCARGKQYDINSYDHIIFSYHGLPVSQVDKVYEDGKPCSDHDCEKIITEENKHCYKAACYATTRLIAGKLGIPESKYTVSFQSRLDKKWLEPFSDNVVVQKAKEGAKRLLVFSPAFVADCLETTVEIGYEYLQLFRKHGGEELQLVESLNTHPLWIDALKQIILEAK